MFNKYTSGHFVKKNATRYGGQQDDYVQQVEKIVAIGVQRLSQAMHNNEDLTVFFNELLSFLGTRRHDIAVKHHSPNKELFGIRRDQTDKWIPIMVTGMTGVYQEYNARLQTLLFPYLQDMSHDKYKFYKTKQSIPLESCANRRTSMDISILTQESCSEWMYNHQIDYLEICKLCSIPFDPTKNVYQALNEMRVNKNLMLTLKLKSNHLYEKVLYAHSLSDLTKYKLQGFKMSDFLLVTINQHIGDKTIKLSQYLTWLHRDWLQDPFEKMLQESIFNILHQDASLIEESLQNICVLFKNAMTLSEVNEKELNHVMALINYEFAHAMPFASGSAAICEYLEMIIYRYYGFHVQYKENTSINMEALILPLQQFVAQYPFMLKLSLTPLDAYLYSEKTELDYETALVSALNNNGVLRFSGLYDESLHVDAVAAINKPVEMAKAREIQKKLNTGTLYAASNHTFFVIPQINVGTDLGRKIEQSFDKPGLRRCESSSIRMKNG